MCNLDSDVIMKPSWLIKLKEAFMTAQKQNPNDNCGFIFEYRFFMEKKRKRSFELKK